VRVWLPGKAKWNFVKCDYTKAIDGGCAAGTEHEEVFVASTRTVALDSVLLPKPRNDGSVAPDVEAAAALKPHECISILKVMVGGGMEGAAVRGMSQTLGTRLCNESNMMFEFDTNEMGRCGTTLWRHATRNVTRGTQHAMTQPCNDTTARPLPPPPPPKYTHAHTPIRARAHTHTHTHTLTHTHLDPTAALADKHKQIRTDERIFARNGCSRGHTRFTTASMGLLAAIAHSTDARSRQAASSVGKGRNRSVPPLPQYHEEAVLMRARSSVSARDLFYRLHYLGYYVIHAWPGQGCPRLEYYMRLAGQKVDGHWSESCKTQPGRFLHWTDCSPIAIFDSIANIDRFLHECRYGRFFLKRTIEVYEQRQAMREGRSRPNATQASDQPSRTVRTISSLKPQGGKHGRPK
jgi:hypothetical protein